MPGFYIKFGGINVYNANCMSLQLELKLNIQPLYKLT